MDDFIDRIIADAYGGSLLEIVSDYGRCQEALTGESRWRASERYALDLFSDGELRGRLERTFGPIDPHELDLVRRYMRRIARATERLGG